MDGMNKAPARLSRRQTSEQAMLTSFEQLFARHGASGVGVNAVLSSAGVGKRLLYEYFGDLEGLAKTWARERPDPLDFGRRRAALARKLRTQSPTERVGTILIDFSEALRAHPWAAQAMLTELQDAGDLGRAMGAIRDKIGQGYERLLIDTQSFSSRDSIELGFVLHAAAIYLALRARFAPNYNGIDLSTPTGWDAAMQMLRRVSRGAIQPRTAVRAKKKRARRPAARRS
jgi:AcrR family transcriptional regulator